MPELFTPAAHGALPQVGTPSVASRMNLGFESVRVFRLLAAFISAAVVGVELPAVVTASRALMAAALSIWGAISAVVEPMQPLSGVANSFRPQLTMPSTVERNVFFVVVVLFFLFLVL